MRILICAMAFSLLACSVDPVPLVYGVDQCHHCKMTLMDRKFGAELVTKKGKVYKFDDINCLLSFYKSENDIKENYQYILIVDFSKTEKLINAEKAYFLKSSEIKSPMASEVAGFESENEALKKQWKATPLAWNDLQKQFGQ